MEVTENVPVRVLDGKSMVTPPAYNGSLAYHAPTAWAPVGAIVTQVRPCFFLTELNAELAFAVEAIVLGLHKFPTATVWPTKDVDCALTEVLEVKIAC